MKNILYFILLCALPSLLEAQTRGNDRFKLPKTPRRYYTQQNHERLLRLDPQMARRRAFMEFGAQHTGLTDLPREVSEWDVFCEFVVW